MPTCMHPCTTCVCTGCVYPHRPVSTHTHAHTHTYTHACMHAHTHTHTHTRSWHPLHQVVWHRGGLQCFSDGVTGPEFRGSVQLLLSEVQSENSSPVSGSAGECVFVCVLYRNPSV